MNRVGEDSKQKKYPKKDIFYNSPRKFGSTVIQASGEIKNIKSASLFYNTGIMLIRENYKYNFAQ